MLPHFATQKTISTDKSKVMVNYQKSEYSNDVLKVNLKPSCLRTYFSQILLIIVIFFFSGVHVLKGLYIGQIDLFSQLITIILGIWLAAYLAYFVRSDI